MTDEDAFLAAIADRPADDTPRLVYADWLDDHGHPDRAAYLRAAVDMASRCGDGRPDGPAVAELLRLAEVLPQDWRAAASGRFSVVLARCESTDRIDSARVIGDAVGCNYGKAWRLCQSAPVRLADRVTFEYAHRVAATLSGSDALVVHVRAADDGLGAAAQKYRIVARYYHTGESDADEEDEEEQGRRYLTPAEAAAEFARFVQRATGRPPDPPAPPDGADVILATGVPADEARGRVAAAEACVPEDAWANRLIFQVEAELESRRP